MSDTLVATHIANLRHSEPDVRYGAVAALAKLRDVSAVPALVNELKAYTACFGPSHTQTVMCMVEALGEIGDCTAVPFLIEALGDSNAKVRLCTVQALGQLADISAVPALLNALREDGVAIDEEAAETLGMCCEMSAIRPLVKDWGRVGSRMCLHIVIALGQIGHPAAISALVMALICSDVFVCKTAAEAVIKMGVNALPHLLRPIREGWEMEWVTGEVRVVLQQIGAPAVNDLIEVLRDANPVVRCRAAEALGRIGAASAVPALTQALQETVPAVCWDAAFALNRLGHEAGLSVILDILKDRDRRVEVFAERNKSERVVGMRRLSQLGEILPQAGLAVLPVLLSAIAGWEEQNAPPFRPSVSALPALLNVMAGWKELDVFFLVAEQLTRLGDSETLPRKILVERGFTFEERIELLDRLRKIRRVGAWYQFPDTPALCRSVMAEPDLEAREEAEVMLNRITLLRGSEGTSVAVSSELVRPMPEEGGPVEPAMMLRASDQPEVGADPDAANRTLWQRLFRR